MSPRNYFFQSMYPEIAKEYHEELASFVPNVWINIGSYTGLDTFFSFTPKELGGSPSNKTINDSSQGIQEDPNTP